MRRVAGLAALAMLLLAGGARAAMDAAADERESPALRAPLPALSDPAEPPPGTAEFSREAPPPPPFDPSWQPPTATPGAPAAQ